LEGKEIINPKMEREKKKVGKGKKKEANAQERNELRKNEKVDLYITLLAELQKDEKEFM
jgi:hypothetical protein